MSNNVTKESVQSEKHAYASLASSSIPLIESDKKSMSVVTDGDAHLSSVSTRTKATSNKAFSSSKGIDLQSIQTIGKTQEKKQRCQFPLNWSIIRVILLILLLLALLAVAIVVPVVLLTSTTTTVTTLLTSTTNGNTTTVTATVTSRFYFLPLAV
jgi:hypothetical protein